MGGGAYIQDVNWVTYLKGIYIFLGGGGGGLCFIDHEQLIQFSYLFL